MVEWLSENGPDWSADVEMTMFEALNLVSHPASLSSQNLLHLVTLPSQYMTPVPDRPAHKLQATDINMHVSDDTTV